MQKQKIIPRGHTPSSGGHGSRPQRMKAKTSEYNRKGIVKKILKSEIDTAEHEGKTQMKKRLEAGVITVSFI